MSFSLTEKQFRARTKTVTRRLGWRFLKPGDRLMGVRQAMGLKKGEKVKRLHAIEVVAVGRQRVSEIFADTEDVIYEGFPKMTALEFVEFFCRTHHCKLSTWVTRIEFRHL